MNHKRKSYRILFTVMIVLLCIAAVAVAVLFGWKHYEEQEYQKKKDQGIIASQLLDVELRDAVEIMRQDDWIETERMQEEYRKLIFILNQQRDEEEKRLAELEGLLPFGPLYVNTTVHLLDIQNKLTPALVEKGAGVSVIGFDYFNADGKANMYKVRAGEAEGYIDLKYLNETYEDAIALQGDPAQYAIHSERGDVLGGGSAVDLDYSPREKGSFENNIMPTECRTLYVSAWRVHEIDKYIEIAKKSDINAFVVDIQDGTSIGYAGEVMKAYSPTSAEYACNSVEDYKVAIDKLKQEGYYVIGRITTFNDTLFVEDHPECGITDNEGELLELSGAYWPSAFNRYTWQYKVDLALEAVDLMGFHEIQFDYVRFPDLVYEREENGTIEYHNTYGESKAQAIQRFLMYATDRLHEKEVYVAADVFGEAGYAYVTAYGQYWPAISNVVDVICAMPYPDHFAASNGWRPWEHPYEIIYEWGQKAASRQTETTSPAVVRTWIQAYNAIKQPYNVYGAKEVSDQIKGLLDAGLTGGYMTWNSAASLEKYESLIPAFKADIQ